MITLRNDVAGFLRLEKFRETPARNRRHAGRTLRDAGDLEESGCKINETYIVIHHPARLGDAFRPHDGQRQVIGVVVGITLVVRKRHAVVGGHDHDCIFEQAALFQLGQHPAQMLIEILHLERVIEHVVAHLLGIRPTRRHVIDVGELLAALGHPRTIFVTAMRLMAAIPKGPRFVFWSGVQEIIEIPRVIYRRYSFGWFGGKSLRIEWLARHLTVFARGIGGNARTPALAGHSNKVTLLAQRLLVGLKLRRKNGPVIARRLELPRVAASDDARPRRRAFAARRVGLGEQ